jgi:hypothetical protein
MDEVVEQREEMPGELSRRVRAAYRAQAAMPNPAAAAELWAAARRRRAMRRAGAMAAVGGPLAAAAAVAMVVWAGPWGSTRGGAPAQRSAPLAAMPDAASAAGVLPGDIDGSGRIDMLDALQLALAVQRGGAGRDVNGDGVVDSRDVESLAAAAVSLDQESTL